MLGWAIGKTWVVVLASRMGGVAHAEDDEHERAACLGEEGHDDPGPCGRILTFVVFMLRAATGTPLPHVRPPYYELFIYHTHRQ